MFVISEFEIFASKPLQVSVHEIIDLVYKPIASVEQSDLEFLVLSHNETRIDPDIKFYISGKLTKVDGTALDENDFTSLTNNFLHSLFIQCSLQLNCTTITQVNEICNNRSFPETTLTYDMCNHSSQMISGN